MASFLKRNETNYNHVLITNGLSLIATEELINQLENKIHLNKTFDYKVRKLPIVDKTTIEVFRNNGTKININSTEVLYIGDIQKLIELKNEN